MSTRASVWGCCWVWWACMRRWRPRVLCSLHRAWLGVHLGDAAVHVVQGGEVLVLREVDATLGGTVAAQPLPAGHGGKRAAGGRAGGAASSARAGQFRVRVGLRQGAMTEPQTAWCCGKAQSWVLQTSRKLQSRRQYGTVASQPVQRQCRPLMLGPPGLSRPGHTCAPGKLHNPPAQGPDRPWVRGLATQLAAVKQAAAALHGSLPRDCRC